MTRKANTGILGNVPPQMTSIVNAVITITAITVTGMRVSADSQNGEMVMFAVRS
jgi:hypothetical protein